MYLRCDDDQRETMAHYRLTAETYIDAVNRKDLDDVLVLFVPDAVINDPVGRRTITGMGAIHAFYEGVITRAQLELTAPIRGSFTNAVAASLVARIPGYEIDIVTITTFNGAGLIQTYSAYWNDLNKRPA